MYDLTYLYTFTLLSSTVCSPFIIVMKPKLLISPNKRLAVQGEADRAFTAADDEVEKMRHSMAETTSLLSGASYEQAQAQMQLYRERLTEHLADPSQPLDLDVASQGRAGQQAEGLQEQQQQQQGQLRTPPRTPGQDDAGRAARAKRVASSREVQPWTALTLS